MNRKSFPTEQTGASQGDLEHGKLADVNNSPKDMDLRGRLYDLEGALRGIDGTGKVRAELLELAEVAYGPGNERGVVDEANRLGRAALALNQGGHVSRCGSALLDAAAGVDL